MEIDIPQDIRAFIDEVVDSFVMWDLLIYFSKKQDVSEPPEDVVRLLGRSMEDVLKPFERLEKMEILIQEKNPEGKNLGRLNLQTPFLPALKKFWEYNERQENRLRILSYLLHKKAR